MFTKLTKPCVRLNLVGRQVSLQIWWAPTVMGSTCYFSLNKEVLACVRPWTMWVPTVSLSMYIPLPMLSFVDNIDHAVPRTPARWTTARPRKGMTRRRRSHSSGGMWVSRGMAWPAAGVVGGGEASVAAQPATGGKSTRWFGRLEQENQRLMKQDDRWMLTIQWSLVIELFVD